MEPRRPLVDDRYEFLRLLATGGMGQVWCARDTVLRRDVAVKVLRSEFTGNPTFLTRFRAEAQHTAALVHPNIAAVHDYGEVVPGPDGHGEHVAYLVMEFVDGEPLSALLAREGRLAPERTLRLLRQVAGGLAAAHAAGVVHRDVKPANLLVTRDGTVKITDFGIASSTASVPLTLTGQVIGTAHYLSPEQAQGSRATPASDVYALGAVAYECLAGRRAFDGENSVQIALKQLREEPLPLPLDVPEQVRRLVERALVKDPAARFPDGAAFRDAVDLVLAGHELEPVPASPPTAAFPGPLPAAGAAADAAPLLPDTTGAPIPGLRPELVPAARREHGRRSAWLLVGTLAAITLAVVAVALGPGGGATTPSALTRSAPPTPGTGSPTRAAVQVDAVDYAGRPVTDVVAELTRMGLRVRVRTISTPDVPAGQVIAVTPGGRLTPGQTVTVTAAVAPAAGTPPLSVDTVHATTGTSGAGTVSGVANGATAAGSGDEGGGAPPAGKGNGPGNGPGNGNGHGKGHGRGKDG